MGTTYLAALNMAEMMHCESIVFPLLASRNNGFDFEVAFKIAKENFKLFSGNNLKQIILVIYGQGLINLLNNRGTNILKLLIYQKEEKNQVTKINILRKRL